jgi:hypothetical protein
LRRTTHFYQPLSIVLHLLIVSEPREYVVQHASGTRIGGFDNPVVHPRSFTTHADDTRASQIRKVTTDLWLIGFQYFHEEADTNFFRAHQVQQPQTRTIRERPEE